MIEPRIDDADFRLYIGDAAEVLARLDTHSIHSVVTSPPYWGQRNYGGEAGQLGAEATPDEYVERLVGIFREVHRVLRDDGTVWLNLGDTYAANRGYQVSDNKHKSHDFAGSNALSVPPGLKAKDLIGIPWRVAFALQADGWWLRSDIIWSKPNVLPESVMDRPTKAHEYLFLLTKAARYFYDAQAIREPHRSTRWGGPTITQPPDTKYAKGMSDGSGGAAEALSRGGREWNAYPAGGRNKRSIWEIPTENYSGAHFAVFPGGLVEPCVMAGTSEFGVCPDCGAPWLRETERVDTEAALRPQSPAADKAHSVRRPCEEFRNSNAGRGFLDGEKLTTGWVPGCEHDRSPISATVLDPFIGSGTTAEVARRLGRRCVGIELHEGYVPLIQERTQQLSLLPK